MIKFQKVFIILALLGNIIVANGYTSATLISNKTEAKSQAQQLISGMSPEERVGQLFLVTFQGTDIDPASQLYDLIVNRQVGGVILLAENNNIPYQDDLKQHLYSFTNSIQSIRYNSTKSGVINSITGESVTPQFVPLFIGLAQEGDGYPNDQILSGLTQLPSQMAIGATWLTDMATQAGSVTGNELQNVGINLLLGPSLDVLENPRIEGGLDLGTRVFGGDPFWVGEMAKAFISGVHQGSQNRIIVAAKHFPGYGGSDRLPGEEVATVRKSLEQLKQIELAPFFAVCGNLAQKEHLTDALLVSHIRYQGFLGNIRAMTRPVSFDATALGELTSLPVISDWRNQGGLLISDDLGSRAVRRFFDPAEKVFDARQVARSAFLAGNDMLYLGNMRSNTDPDSYTSIIHILDSFSQKYREDPTFATRVDASVLNILTAKYRLYPSFELQNINPNSSTLDQVGNSSQTAFTILHEAATLISPDEQNLAINLPNPPSVNEDMVFFTSTLSGKQCLTCPEQAFFPVDGLEKAVLGSYGPPTASQVRNEMLSSYSFKDLTVFLSNGIAPENLEHDISRADWIIFSILDISQQNTDTEALRILLADRYDLVRNKKLIVFAFSAPYFLDATDISKLTAYYGIYSKVPAALDVAARILFHELTPRGASPVSIPGTGYDLIQITEPDPEQIIPLTLNTKNPADENLTQTPQPTDVPLFHVGDKLPLQAGIILDQNKNPVPDGTTVRFIITRTGETTTTQQIDAVTAQGLAYTQFMLDTKGIYEIRVVSEPALVSQILQLNVTSDMGAMVTAIAPTFEAQSTIASEQSGAIASTQSPSTNENVVGLTFAGWIIALMSLLIEAGLGYLIFSQVWKIPRWGFRSVLLVLITGWLSYVSLAFGLIPPDKLSLPKILLVTLVGGGIGLAGIMIWYWIVQLKEDILARINESK